MGRLKRQIHINPSTFERRVFATYELDGDLVRVHVTPDLIPVWEHFEPSIVAGRLLQPEDGRAYYDALEVAFSNSTFCYVDQVDASQAPAWARSPATLWQRSNT